jgi:hypothetical protein
MALAVEPAPSMRPSSVETAVAASMEPAALEAVEAATSVEALVAVEFMIPVPAAFAAETVMATEPVMIAKSIAIAKSVMIAVPATAVVFAPSAIVTASVEPVEPGPRPDEHAARKIVRSIVAVRCACIWGIPVVAVCAGGRRPDVNRRWPHGPNAYAKPHRDLCMSSSRPRDKRQKPHCECIFEISHFQPPGPNRSHWQSGRKCYAPGPPTQTDALDNAKCVPTLSRDGAESNIA